MRPCVRRGPRQSAESAEKRASIGLVPPRKNAARTPGRAEKALPWSVAPGKDTVCAPSAREERPPATRAGRLTQRLECLPYKEEVGGSNPSSPTTLPRPPCAQAPGSDRSLGGDPSPGRILPRRSSAPNARRMAMPGRGRSPLAWKSHLAPRGRSPSELGSDCKARPRLRRRLVPSNLAPGEQPSRRGELPRGRRRSKRSRSELPRDAATAARAGTTSPHRPLTPREFATTAAARSKFGARRCRRRRMRSTSPGSDPRPRCARCATRGTQGPIRTRSSDGRASAANSHAASRERRGINVCFALASGPLLGDNPRSSHGIAHHVGAGGSLGPARISRRRKT